ncbi:MAG: ABC transporter permease [Propionibacteriaceae bacterium]|jgi:D-methionine transport system permease protein|nr:ABC transporter permease [Propionibacteriaceae bacterium]
MTTRLPDLTGLLGQALVETLYIVAISLAVGTVFGLAVGLGLYTTRSGGLYASRPVFVTLNFLVNFFRPIPFVIFIGAVQPLARLVTGTGIGNPAIIFALSLSAGFFVARVVEQNLFSVDPGVIEASRAMGASRLKTIAAVLIPEALGPLVLGLTFSFVAVVDASAIAGVLGGGGLGNFSLQYGFRQFDWAVTWTTVLIIVAIVQLGQLLGNTVSRRLLRR